MAVSTFPRALKHVLIHEGGYANHPKDPGGPTNFGITQRTYDAWRKANGLVKQPVRHISHDEVEAIYREQYWEVVWGDRLPAGIDYAVFDFAVNSGAARAVRELQRLLGNVRVDGIMGMNTLAAVEAACRHDEASVIRRYMARREAFWRSLKTFGTFGKGWLRRGNEVEQNALLIAKRDPTFGAVTPDTGGGKALPEDVKLDATPAGQGATAVGTGIAIEAAKSIGEAMVNNSSTLREIANTLPGWVGVAVSFLAAGMILVGTYFVVRGLLRARAEGAVG